MTLAYNTRIHSVTGFSPFELLFGLKMNKFDDWESSNNNLGIPELIKRSDELANLKNDTRQRALVNIESGQEAQKHIQDSRTPPTDETLPLNSKVFVKQEGLIGKLEPRFKGPYTVARRNASGNYELLDVDNNLLPNSYPLHKLKPVKDPKETTQESWEVDKIISHRKIGKENEYLVKWKDCPDSENTWLKKSFFNSIQPIQEYLDSLKNPNQPKRSRGRPRKIPTLMASILSILLFFTLTTPVSLQEIKANFRFCDDQSSVKTILDIESSCHLDDKTSGIQYFSNKQESMALLIKSKHAVYGRGFQCKEKVTTYSFERSFPYIFQQIEMKVVEEKYKKLSREDCEYMINTKRCDKDLDMSCDSDGCYGSYTPTRDGTESFWGTITKKGYTCWITNRVITAETIETKIFHSVNGPCKATDLQCQMVDSIIIWNRNVFHRCPYEFVDVFEFEVGPQNRLISNSLFFQIDGSFMECNMTMFSTNEGILLTRDAKAR